MEVQRTQTINRRPSPNPFTGIDGISDDQERLAAILNANADIHREKMLYRTHQEEAEASMMKNPLTTKTAFSYLGLMLGILPPAAIFIKLTYPGKSEPFLIAMLIVVNLICALVGYFSGKLIGKMVSDMENYSWTVMLLTLPFIGVLWGVMTGGAGGFIFFGIGAFFGAPMAAIVGALAITVFTIFHRLLKRGEMMERNQFLPLAFGITSIISALILGL